MQTRCGDRPATMGSQQPKRLANGQQPGRSPTTSRGQITLEVPQPSSEADDQHLMTLSAKKPKKASIAQPGAPLSNRPVVAEEQGKARTAAPSAVAGRNPAPSIAALLEEAKEEQHAATRDSCRSTLKAASDAAVAEATKEHKTRADSAERKLARAEERIRDMQQLLALAKTGRSVPLTRRTRSWASSGTMRMSTRPRSVSSRPRSVPSKLNLRS